MSLEVKYAIFSHKGLIRSSNEDVIDSGTLMLLDTAGTPLDLHYMIVCDGMGGHKAGETASKLAVESVIDYIKSLPFWPSLESDIRCQLHDAIIAAHQNIKMLSQYEYDKDGMGTTIVLLILAKYKAYTAWSGDSRLYVYTHQSISEDTIKGLNLLTSDHTSAWNLVEKKLLTIDQLRNHPQANSLTQVLGGETPPNPEFKSYFAQNGDRFLVCSDGVTLHVSFTEINQILSNYPEPNSAIDVIKELVLSRGAKDNFSIGILNLVDTQWSKPPLHYRSKTEKEHGGIQWLTVFSILFILGVFILFYKTYLHPFQHSQTTVTTFGESKNPNTDGKLQNEKLSSSVSNLNLAYNDLATISDSFLIYLDSVGTSIIASKANEVVSSEDKLVVDNIQSLASNKKVHATPKSQKKTANKKDSLKYDAIYNKVSVYLEDYKSANQKPDIYAQAYMIRLEQLLIEIQNKKKENNFKNPVKTDWQIVYLQNKFDNIQTNFKPE